MARWTQKFILIASIMTTMIGAPPAWCADLVGTVSNSRGEPVPGISVTVVNSAGIDSGKAISDAHGRYAISNLAPGTYKLGSSGQWVMSYVGDRGLTVNWGLAPHAAAVAVASQGTAPDSSMTMNAAPAKISQARAKPKTHRSRDDSRDDSDDDQN
jgi:hypothetical protein